MDIGGLRATVHEVAKSQTRLKQLSMHACIFKGTTVKMKKTNKQTKMIESKWERHVVFIGLKETSGVNKWNIFINPKGHKKEVFIKEYK